MRRDLGHLVDPLDSGGHCGEPHVGHVARVVWRRLDAQQVKVQIDRSLVLGVPVDGQEGSVCTVIGSLHFEYLDPSVALAVHHARGGLPGGVLVECDERRTGNDLHNLGGSSAEV